MIRHPHYLEVPRDIHWYHDTTERHCHQWGLIEALVPLEMFLIGVGVTSGLV